MIITLLPLSYSSTYVLLPLGVHFLCSTIIIPSFVQLFYVLVPYIILCLLMSYLHVSYFPMSSYRMCPLPPPASCHCLLPKPSSPANVQLQNSPTTLTSFHSHAKVSLAMSLYCTICLSSFHSPANVFYPVPFC